MKRFFETLINKKYISHILGFLILMFIFSPQIVFAQAEEKAVWGDYSGADWVGNLVAGTGLLFLKISAFFLWLAGMFLDFIVYVAIVKMGIVVKDPSINSAWGIFRDVLNLFFIFGLLYLSIMTIITGWSENSKKRLGLIIFSALLINFSFLFTSILIDTSNVVALTFYDNMGDCQVPTQTVGDDPTPLITFENRSVSDGGLSFCFMNKLGLPSFLDLRGKGPQEVIRSTSAMELLKMFIMISIFLTIAAIVFFAMAIVIFVRFVSLIFVLITSPIMFGGGILPFLKKFTDKWSETLLSNLIAIPIMFLFLYISYQIAGPGIFSGVANGIVVSGDPNISGDLANSAWGNIMSDDPATGNGAGFGIIMNFIIVIAFLIGSIVVGKQAGAKGAEAGMGMAMGLGAFAGKKTLGWAGSKLAKTNTTMQDWAKNGSGWRKRVSGVMTSDKFFGAGSVSRGLSTLGSKAAKSTFDIRNTGVSSLLGSAGLNAGKGSSATFEKDEKAAAKALEERNKLLGIGGKADDADVQSRAKENARETDGYRRAEADLNRAEQTAKQAKEEQGRLKGKMDTLKSEIEKLMQESEALSASGQVVDADAKKQAAAGLSLQFDQIEAQFKNAKTVEDGQNENVKELQSIMTEMEKAEATKILKNNPSKGYRQFGGKLNPFRTGRNKAVEDRIKSMYKSKDDKAQEELIKRLSKELEKAKEGGGEAPKPESGDKK